MLTNFFWCAWAYKTSERIISSLVTEQRDFSIAFVMERTHERVQRVMVQLSLQIPTGCSQGALHESLKLKLLANFNNLPYFQVYLHGLGSQLWTLDARLDNGVPITSARLRNKIRETILSAFEDSLQATDFILTGPHDGPEA